MLLGIQKRKRNGTSPKSIEREASRLQEIVDLFSFSPRSVEYINSKMNPGPFHNLVKNISKISPVKDSITLEDCYRLQLWSGMSDEMWDIMKKSLKFLERDILFCSKSIKNISKEEKDKIKKEIGVEELPNTKGGAFVNLKKTLIFLIILLADGKIPNKSTWKLMLDGRPKGNSEFEVVVGITPMNFGKKVQSVSMVFPIAIYEGSEDRKQIQSTLAKLIEEINNLTTIHISDDIPDHSINWIMVNDLKMTWQLFSLPKGACPYCCCTKLDDRAKLTKLKSYKTFSRKFKPDDLLFKVINITSKNGNIVYFLVLILLYRFYILFVAHEDESSRPFYAYYCKQCKRNTLAS